MKKVSSLLLFALLLCGLAVAQKDSQRAERPPNEKIVKGPAIESLGESWALVAWSTDTGGSSVVRYGTDPNHLTQMAEAPYQVDKGKPGETHRVKLDHLRPGTTYYYFVDSGQGQGTGTEAKSNVEQFTTRQ